jgi:hypothetical protein
MENVVRPVVAPFASLGRRLALLGLEIMSGRVWLALPGIIVMDIVFAIATGHPYGYLACAFIIAIVWAVLAQLRASADMRRLAFQKDRADVERDERIRVDRILSEAVTRSIKHGGLSRTEVLALRDAIGFRSYTELWRNK